MSARLLIWLVLVVAIVAIPHSILSAITARDRALAAQRQLTQCKQLASRIEDLIASPSTIAATKQSFLQIRDYITSAAELSKTKNNILQIREQDPRPVKDSPYVEQLTQIKFGDVELIRLVRFLKELTASTEEHGVDSIRLDEPHIRNEGEPEQWAVEVVLSSLVYEPS